MMRLKFSLATGVAAFCMMSAPALAQSVNPDGAGEASSGNAVGPTQETGAQQRLAAADDEGVGDIIVTAQKVSESAQRSPAAIVAMNAADLEARGVADLQDLQKVVPNANLLEQGNLIQVFIRGIGTRNDLPNFAASSAFLYNGVTVPRYGNSGLIFDLGRIESIAGPQGTLYGGTAAGGAVNAYSALPTWDFSGSASAQLTNYNGVYLDIAQNLPLSDNLALRVAGTYGSRGSYYGRDLDEPESWSGRATLFFEPSENFSAQIFYTHVEDGGEPSNTLVINPLVDPSDPWFIRPIGTAGNEVSGAFTRQDSHSDIISAVFELKLGDNSFTYIPGYIDSTTDFEKFLGGSGSRGLQVFNHERQMTHEFRWNRNYGAVDIVAGVFYLNDKIDYNHGILSFAPPLQAQRTQVNATDQTNESLSVFGQAVISATDRLRFTLGGRLSKDKIDAVGLGTNDLPFDFRRSESHADYRLGVAYDISDSVMAYGNLQTGYIPFGYDADSGGPTSLVPTSDLTAYSAGLKSRFLGNKLELNSEFFYYRYSDFQAIVFNNATATSTVLNAPLATLKGVDVNIRARVTPNFNFGGGVVYEDAKYDDFKGVGATGPYNYDGNQLINAPEWNVIFGAEYIIGLGSLGELRARVDGHHSSSYYGNFTNAANQRQDAYTTADASLTFYTSDEKWSLRGFVKNIGNEPVFNTLSAGSGSLQAPRTYGVRLSANW
jgi:iron complex outermembrane receptor protein